MLGALALVLAAVPAAAEPYEDGGDPNAPAGYASTPRPGWMTAAGTDRVHDIAQIGDTIYVAGSFAGIRPGRTGPVSFRAHLVALNAATGEPRWSFDPRFDGPVYTLAVSADGTRLYAGGEFATVDGWSRRRLVALTAAGNVVGSWHANASGGAVRSVVATGSHLYVSGNFDHIDGQFRRRLARLQRSNGDLDRAWRPQAGGGSVLTLEMPSGRDRIYAGGRFTSVNGQARAHLAALRTEDGGLIGSFGAQPGREVFDLLADGSGRVWAALGGPLGRAEAYWAASGGRFARWETEGDVQTVERIGGRIWFGGHELSADRRFAVATVDPATLRWDTASFAPSLPGGDGVWALHAGGGWLWVGGNVNGAFTGFARFAPA
jgi:hypothetical protein